MPPTHEPGHCLRPLNTLFQTMFRRTAYWSDDLPSDWALREIHTQTLGDAWLDECAELILMVPSVIMLIASAPERNVLINHRHSGSARITITAVTPFTFDPRLSIVDHLLSHGGRWDSGNPILRDPCRERFNLTAMAESPPSCSYVTSAVPTPALEFILTSQINRFEQ